jgi:hypothetical protein
LYSKSSRVWIAILRIIGWLWLIVTIVLLIPAIGEYGFGSGLLVLFVSIIVSVAPLAIIMVLTNMASEVSEIKALLKSKKQPGTEDRE